MPDNRSLDRRGNQRGNMNKPVSLLAVVLQIVAGATALQQNACASFEASDGCGKSVPLRVARVRKLLALNTDRVTQAHTNDGVQPVPWVNWINWGNWPNWNNWHNWLNWGNW